MKLNKIISVFTSVLVGGALLSSTVNAVSSDGDYGMGDMDIYTYTFNELMQMTDEEVLSIYSDRDALYITNFGDETLTDEEKFEAFCSKYDEDLGNEVFYCYKAFISGEYTDPFFAIHFKNKFKLDYSATAEDFGFPSDWKFICYTGEYSASDHFWWGDLPEYRLFIPTEVFNDYETYVRLNFAMDNLIIQDKGINYNIHDPFERRVYEFSIGPMPIEEKAFMYNELMQLTDDEIVDIFGDEYVQYGFGSDTIDDNQKFMNDFDENEEKLYNQWISGETKPFFRVITDENPNLEYNITAAGLGFPKDWEVKPDEDYVGEENLKAYDVYFSNDVLEDYEKYVRLNCALNHLLKESQYPVTKYEDMFEACNKNSPEPTVTTTEPITTTTKATTKATTTTPKATTTKAATTTPKATTTTPKATTVTAKATTVTTKATTTTPKATTVTTKATTATTKATTVTTTTPKATTTTPKATTVTTKATTTTPKATTVTAKATTATTTTPVETTTSTTATMPVTNPVRPVGDIDGDNKITVRDCAYIASKLAKGEKLSDIADYNKDGKVNVRDAAAIARDLAKGKI